MSDELTVRVVEEERANLVCYFLASVLRRNVESRSPVQLAGNIESGLKVVAGGMTAFVYGVRDVIEVSPIERGATAVGVEGELGVLLGVLLGGGVVIPVLKGDIKVKGSPLRALRVLKLFRTPGKRKGRTGSYK